MILMQVSRDPEEDAILNNIKDSMKILQFISRHLDNFYKRRRYQTLSNQVALNRKCIVKNRIAGKV